MTSRSRKRKNSSSVGRPFIPKPRRGKKKLEIKLVNSGSLLMRLGESVGFGPQVLTLKEFDSFLRVLARTFALEVWSDCPMSESDGLKNGQELQVQFSPLYRSLLVSYSPSTIASS